METAQVLNEFDRLVREADRLEEDYLTPLADREAVHEAALLLVTKHSELRSEFVEKFGEMLVNHDLELFEYCMHELRWPEVKALLDEAVSSAVDRKDIRARDYLAGVKAAFTDEWSGREFYRRYSK
jgi:hypothetical protein